MVTDSGNISGEYEAILKMTCGRGSSGTQRTRRGKEKAETAREHAMYPGVKALFSFIANAIDKEYRNLSNSPDLSTPAHPLLRKIIPFEHTDRTPEGADDRDRIDIGLTFKDDKALESPYRDSTILDYTKMLALIEAKNSNTEKMQCDAYTQLFKYSHHIFVNQHDRRFVWGLTVCGTVFRVCLLGFKRMVSSAPIDVATSEGRETLVKWLANISLCEGDRLGYDPTLYYNARDRRWEIKTYDDSTDTHKTFEIISCLRISDRVCGRHTRCFRCKEIELSGDADTDSNPAELREVLVKRAWAIASRDSDDKSRDEVSLLREINNALKDNKDLEGKYPTLLAGGIVKITDEYGEVFDDTVDTAFAGLETETLEALGFRVQKSMAMTPIGQDIRRCESVDELIAAAADVMEVHSAIRKQCNILHRDISVNNILINRNGPGGRACGMLIDFDCALRIDDTTDHKARSEMTGTFPFMSINNLEASNVMRTELDDWESLVYVLCWLGTFGINTGDEKTHQRSNDSSLDILRWRNGKDKAVANAKRSHMHTHEYFVFNIMRRFIQDSSYFPLMGLVANLRRTLFDNSKVSANGRGTLKKDADMDIAFGFASIPEEPDSSQSFVAKVYWDSGFDENELDPFKRRATCAGNISDALLETIKAARKAACDRILSKTGK
ncbi:hypothetical protein IWW48_002043 [Coemansia sp. RSA 1200]|nr:hypothetical protein IWW48_002043 [Coemansia sp. RSA 1200]